MQRHQQHIAHKQQGFTLIELLIAVVIVAIGLLGHAALQIQSVNTAQQARFAQTANVAMLDLVQRFSAMPAATINNEFNVDNLADGATPVSNKDCNDAAVTCTRTEFAAFELKDWFLTNNVYLPQLRFSLQHVNNLVTVRMTWDANLSGAGAADCSADASGKAHQCSEVAVWVR
ncbi:MULTISPECIES: type IV pilus modification protein PilV [unclassified Agarivorans]|uniref:type IV pilus modification protein PilV n=1 Tax=unclassified Agarivorans TaxID=2636026 RepID=UPI0026E1EBEC|nr:MULTISPECIES: type IV pilus modification protein PilV [unclassified Agarivorans]MDO6687479.1 type IV pilus modification protein PilV [Agarivorans sp. 3_MG-2023]MDO6715245.1 type IV pilus modification protein PilV [Agarivorans sp. 2_MG-2023]